MSESLLSASLKSITVLFISLVCISSLLAFAEAGTTGGGCFGGETNIETSEGLVKIADVTTGDTVRGFDESGNIVENTILSVFSVQRDYYYLLATEDSEVKVTAEHPFYTCDKIYKTTEQLQPEDCVYILRDGEHVESLIVAKKRVNEPITVYNLQVSNTNTFFANSFAVHNKGEGCFLSNTIIDSERGKIAISAMRRGDIVFGFDTAGNIVSNMVDNVFTTRRDHYFTLRTTRSEVNATAEHPLYSDNGYKTIEQLQLGDYVYLLSNGKLIRDRVVSKQRVDEEVTVYNLQVSHTSTFFANGFAVHNKGPGTGTNGGTSDSETDTDTETGGGTTADNTTTTTTTTTQPPEKALTIEILETPTQLLTRGDVVRFRVKLTDGYGKIITGADAIVFNSFFSQTLFDDGEHADASSNDGVYAAEVTIPSNQTSGTDTIFFGAALGSYTATASINLTFDTGLKIFVATDNSSYEQGQNIQVSGRVRNARGEVVEIKKATIFFKSTVEAGGSRTDTLVRLQYSLLHRQQYRPQHGQPYRVSDDDYSTAWALSVSSCYAVMDALSARTSSFVRSSSNAIFSSV